MHRAQLLAFFAPHATALQATPHGVPLRFEAPAACRPTAAAAAEGRALQSDEDDEEGAGVPRIPPSDFQTEVPLPRDPRPLAEEGERPGCAQDLQVAQRGEL